MKNLREKSKYQTGFSTVELLIAFAVAVLCITAVAGVVFGTQSIGIDTETNLEAQTLASKLLEDARVVARNDFNSLSSTASGPGGFYQTQTNIIDYPPCVKDIIGKVNWTNEFRPQNVELRTRVTNPEEAIALMGDCPSGPPGTPWKMPKSDNLGDLIDPSGNDGVDVDVVADESTGNKIAILGSQMNQTDKSDFWVFNVNNPASPALLNAGGMNLSDKCTNDSPKVCGVSAVDVAGHYAYVANLGNGDLSGNNDSDFLNAQLQIIDISDPTNPSRAGFFSLNDSSIPATVRVSPLGSFPEGRVIFYYKGFVYIGLKETIGHEFHVIDVANPAHPVWKGSFRLGTGIGHNVNAIIVREQMYLGLKSTIAFIASSVTDVSHPELYILNVTNPAAISQIGTYNAPGVRYGLSLALAGNKIYLGREGGSSSSDTSFNIVDVSNLATPAQLGPGRNFKASVVSMVVMGDLAFIGTTDANAEFQIWNISDPDHLALYNCNLSDGNFSQLGNGMDYFDNTVYIAVRSQNAFRIIYDSLSATCSP